MKVETKYGGRGGFYYQCRYTMIDKMRDALKSFWRKLTGRHVRCGDKWDYDYSGYNSLRPYCHTCNVYKYPKEGEQ